MQCFVLGSEVYDRVSVRIDSTENINALKVSIKKKKAPSLDSFSASSLKLWNIFIPFDNLQKIPNDLADRDSLDPSQMLFDVFPDFTDLPAHCVHILVGKPSCTFPPSLLCYVMLKLFTIVAGKRNRGESDNETEVQQEPIKSSIFTETELTS